MESKNQRERQTLEYIKQLIKTHDVTHNIYKLKWKKNNIKA